MLIHVEPHVADVTSCIHVTIPGDHAIVVGTMLDKPAEFRLMKFVVTSRAQLARPFLRRLADSQTVAKFTVHAHPGSGRVPRRCVRKWSAAVSNDSRRVLANLAVAVEHARELVVSPLSRLIILPAQAAVLLGPVHAQHFVAMC